MMSTLNTRRRMLLGGKKEPVYIFKEGEGFKANPLPGVTLQRAGGGYSTSRITLTPDSDDGTWRRDDTRIGIEGSSGVKVINWKITFPGYKKIFFEVANSSSIMDNYPLRFGLAEKRDPSEDDVNWYRRSSYSSTERKIFEFDISDVKDSIILAYGGYAYSVAGEERTTSSYIYNIWLE